MAHERTYEKLILASKSDLGLHNPPPFFVFSYSLSLSRYPICTSIKRGSLVPTMHIIIYFRKYTYTHVVLCIRRAFKVHRKCTYMNRQHSFTRGGGGATSFSCSSSSIFGPTGSINPRCYPVSVVAAVISSDIEAGIHYSTVAVEVGWRAARGRSIMNSLTWFSSVK